MGGKPGKEIFAQIHDRCPICKRSFGWFLLPNSDEGQEACKGFKIYQIVRTVVYGIRRPRSLKQLNLFMSACQLVAANSDEKWWDTKDRVVMQIKVAARFEDRNRMIVTPNGDVIPYYRSISFKNLKHLEACRFFDIGFEILAIKYFRKHPRSKDGMDDLVAEFIKVVKANMGRG